MSDIELAERVEKLERDNRRLKRGGIALVAILVALAIAYATATRPVPDVIKAHEFDAVDNFGTVQMAMRASLGRGPSITLSNEAGKPRIEMDVSVGPQIKICNAHGKALAEIQTIGGMPSVSLSNAKSKSSVTMYAESDGPEILLEGVPGAPLVSMSAVPGSPSIAVSSLKGSMYLSSTGAAKFGPAGPLKK